MAKFLFVLACIAVISSSEARLVVIKSIGKDNLVVSLTGQDNINLKKGRSTTIQLEEGWSGTITAVKRDCQACNNGPQTVGNLELGSEEDTYSVSLANGFNVGLSIVPLKNKSCDAAVCQTKINKICPQENRTVDNKEKTVACDGPTTLFRTVCPKANNAELNSAVKTCKAASYMILVA